MWPWIILSSGTFFVLGVLWLVLTYNGLVTLRNRFKNAFAQIDVQLKRRYDLIPNLVEAVKGYMAHEKDVLERVTQARSAAYAASNLAAQNPTDVNAIRQLGTAEGALVGMLGQFRMLVENYPELKAADNTARLMEELTSTENRIAFARQAYNDAVMSYNTRRESFPTNLLTNAFGFREAALFQIREHEAAVPGVKL